MSRLKRKIIIAAIIITASTGICFGAMYVLLVLGYVNTAQEIITGETPYNQLNAYMRAIIRGDEQAAWDVWELPPELAEEEDASLREWHQQFIDEVEERRQQVTGELLEMGVTDFTVLDTEWWSTCCES